MTLRSEIRPISTAWSRQSLCATLKTTSVLCALLLDQNWQADLELPCKNKLNFDAWGGIRVHEQLLELRNDQVLCPDVIQPRPTFGRKSLPIKGK